MFFVRKFPFKRHIKQHIKGQMVAMEDDHVVIDINGVAHLEEAVGKYARVWVSRKCKTSTGEFVTLTRILAQGRVSEVKDGLMTVRSDYDDPLISNGTFREVKEQTRPIVNVHFLQF